MTIILCLVIAVTPGLTQTLPDQTPPDQADAILAKPDVAGRKLKRGFHNIFLGWMEIPQGIESIGAQHGVGAAATLGFLHGTGRAIQRTATGIFDVLTFPLDTGDGYGAMIESEFDAVKNQESSVKTQS